MGWAFENLQVVRIRGQQFHQPRTLKPQVIGILYRNLEQVFWAGAEKLTERRNPIWAIKLQRRKVFIEDAQRVCSPFENFLYRAFVFVPGGNQLARHDVVDR